MRVSAESGTPYLIFGVRYGGGKTKQFPDCVELCLGHAPRTVTERSYVDPDQERFDNAIEWLGQQFGLREWSEGSPRVENRSLPRIDPYAVSFEGDQGRGLVPSIFLRPTLIRPAGTPPESPAAVLARKVRDFSASSNANHG